jgi:hyperosmotically inducible periplasmic protein
MKRAFAVVAGSLAGFWLLALAGCAASMVAGRTPHANPDVTSEIHGALEASDKVKAWHVDVVTQEGVVYLTGVVDTLEARREAGRVASGTAGVRGVVNDLTVEERTFGSWADDVLVSSKVLSKLIDDSEITTGGIGVSSSLGVVTLSGSVSSQTMRSDAGRVALGTNGVITVHNELLVSMVRP